MKKWLSNAVSAVFWIALWECVHLAVGENILVPSPLSVLERLGGFCTEGSFWISLFVSLFRVLSGLVLGTVLGAVLAVLTAKSNLFRSLFSPALHVIKATPVASFIILAILWLSVENVPVFTAMLIVLPTVWANTEKGILSVDKDLLQMGRAFRLSEKEIFFRITLPTVKPFFAAALNSAVGMAWKAGIAAEVICPKGNSIGSALHDSKIYFETVDTFAWTAAVVILSVLLEKAVLWLTAKGGLKNGRI
ncbi:MAG: ABC transporter permease subunit [Oscillospiraceae bacterium]|nr:ABC transporter permease subunit [Oscillospiraceae bacterium]